MDVVELTSNLELERLLSQLPELGCPNLLKKSIYELDFLQLIDQNRHLYYDENFVKYSIIRYEKYWMPFLAEFSSQMEEDLKFAPPLDIHWVWHVHMLCPVQYNKDCTATIGNLIPWNYISMYILKFLTPFVVPTLFKNSIFF